MLQQVFQYRDQGFVFVSKFANGFIGQILYARQQQTIFFFSVDDREFSSSLGNDTQETVVGLIKVNNFRLGSDLKEFRSLLVRQLA